MSYALNLIGTPTWLSAPSINAYNFGTGDFTLQCWVKTTQAGTVISRKGTDGGAGNGGFLLVIKPDGSIKLATDNGTGFYEINTVRTSIIDGNWHFLTGVRQSNALSIYLDGNLITSSVNSNTRPPINVNNSLALFIGFVSQIQEPYKQFQGDIDEVRIWNIALSQSQIKAQMNQNLIGNEPGLVGYYTFEDQDGYDKSPLHNKADMIGFVRFTTPGALSQSSSFIDMVQQAVNGYFSHLSQTTFIRILDTPHVWGMPFSNAIMPQASQRKASFQRAIEEIIQKTRYRCDLSSLNSPDPDWARVVLGAMDTCLTQRMGRTRAPQFRFFFGQTPMVPVGEPDNLIDFKAAIIRLFRERSQYWEIKPEIWMGRFYRLKDGVISSIEAKVFGSGVIDSDDTKMTWNHTKIISVDGVESLVGGHNLNMDLFISYPPVHDVSIVSHGDAAYGAQLFLNQMWVCGTDLFTKEMLRVDNLTWTNQDSNRNLPSDPFVLPEVQQYMQAKQQSLINMHMSGVQTGTDTPYNNGESPVPGDIRSQDLQTISDLQLDVFPVRQVYNTYEGFADYKMATRVLTLGKYWNGPDYATNFQKASEIMKQTLILSAKRSIKMSQMDLISAWKKNWSDHVVCQWLIQALLANPNLQVQVVVSPLDAGAGAQGDQYSFGSGAIRTFELIKYYMYHDVATDQPISDPNGTRANALNRLFVAPFYYTDQVPPTDNIEGDTYKWPDLSKEGYTATLKQPPLSVKPPKQGVIGSAAWAVVDASGYIYPKVKSAPGNHAKIMIVDDSAYVVGSDNLYPGFLSEVDYLIEGDYAVGEMLNSYWNQLWKYSGPHSISGQGPNPYTDYLTTDVPLGLGGVLVSKSKNYFVIMQSDGNLCVYNGTPDNQGSYVWGSMKTGPGGQFFTIVQNNGALCTYYGTFKNKGQLLWSNNVQSEQGQFFLIMQDDGNLCVYRGTGPDDNQGFVWGSKN